MTIMINVAHLMGVVRCIPRKLFQYLCIVRGMLEATFGKNTADLQDADPIKVS